MRRKRKLGYGIVGSRRMRLSFMALREEERGRQIQAHKKRMASFMSTSVIS